MGTGDCTHDDDRDVVRSQVPEAQLGVFDGIVDGMRQRMGLVSASPS